MIDGRRVVAVDGKTVRGAKDTAGHLTHLLAALDHGSGVVRVGSAPQVMATIRNTAVSILRLAGHTSIAAALRHHSRNPHRPIDLLHTI